jgi:phosphohistidine phosphatase SixA
MKSIKYLFCIAVSLFVCSIVSGQVAPNKNHTFYIVRHAEKDTGNNPPISAAGKKRAGDLYRLLKKKKIDIILVSQFRRTAMTADSLRIYKGIDTMQYVADADASSLVESINKLPAHVKRILIIGHSNTLPAIIRKTGVQAFSLKEIPDHEYDNLFIVTLNNNKASLKSKKFGTPSVMPAKETKMNILQ